MSLGTQLAIAGVIALVGVVCFALGGRPRRHHRRRPVRYEWSCTWQGQEWTWTAELIGGVWSVHTDRGDGTLLGSIYEVRAWIAHDLAHRLAEVER